MAYACADCHKSFRIRADYNRHRKQHDRPFRCHLCERSFGLKTNLNRHKLASHTSSVSVIDCKWPGCSTKTSREDYLRKHMREAHRNAHLNDSTSKADKFDAEIERLYQKSIHEARASAANLRPILHEVVVKGDSKEVLDLVAQGADVNAEVRVQYFALENWVETPLSLSVLCGHEGIFWILLRFNPTLQSLSWAFLASVRTGNCILAEALIEKGVNVNERHSTRNDYTALDIAASKNQTGMVKFLLSKDADFEPPEISGIGSPLMVASIRGHTDVIRLLLEYGANVNRQGELFGGAWGAASSRGHKDAIRLLIEKGADINASLGVASPLMEACRGGYYEVVNLLLENGADINREGGRCGSALGEAVYFGHKDVVRLLLEKGADPQISMSAYGWPPRGWAIRLKKPTMEANLARIRNNRGGGERSQPKSRPKQPRSDSCCVEKNLGVNGLRVMIGETKRRGSGRDECECRNFQRKHE